MSHADRQVSRRSLIKGAGFGLGALAAAPTLAQPGAPVWSDELAFGDGIPTGTYLDMTANLPVVDPARVQAPVLPVRGEHDGIATEEDLFEFYRRLPNADRQFVVLAGASHAVALGYTRSQLWHVMRAFLEMPERASRP